QSEAAPRKNQLIGLTDQRRADVADLEKAVTKLRRQLEADRRRSQASRSEAAGASQESLLAAEAGTTDLKGSGLTVRLSDSARQPTPSEDASALRIHDTD